MFRVMRVVRHRYRLVVNDRGCMPARFPGFASHSRRFYAEWDRWRLEIARLADSA